jgi:hypothetical protein
MLASEARLPRILADGRRPRDERRSERAGDLGELTSRIVSAGSDRVDERHREGDASRDRQARTHRRRELRGLAADNALVELVGER